MSSDRFVELAIVIATMLFGLICTCVRPPDEGIMLGLCPIFLTIRQTLPSSRRSDPAKVYQRFGSSVQLKNSLRHFPTSPLNFSGVRKCALLARFSTPVAFDVLWLRNGPICRKSKTSPWSGSE